jgi:hypothetical protein
VIAQLVRSGASTPSEMCDGLRNLKISETVLGPIAFDGNRDVRSAPVILKIVPGGFAYF